MPLSTRTEQWIELAASLTRADFVRDYPGYFLICSVATSDSPHPFEEVRWIRRRVPADAADAPILVGRASNCDISLVHPSVAKRHAQLRVDEAGRPIAVTDLGSQSGTRLNGQRIAARVQRPLDHQDQLQLGLVETRILESGLTYHLLVEMSQQGSR
jgi:hypothetical protein